MKNRYAARCYACTATVPAGGGEWIPLRGRQGFVSCPTGRHDGRMTRINVKVPVGRTVQRSVEHYPSLGYDPDVDPALDDMCRDPDEGDRH